MQRWGCRFESGRLHAGLCRLGGVAGIGGNYSFSRVKYLMDGRSPAIKKGSAEARERYACLAAGQAGGPIGLAGDVRNAL